MENVNGINQVWGVLHCGVTPGGNCNETNGLGAFAHLPGSSCQSAFHTYRFEWDRSITPNQFRWYVDGVNYHTLSQNQFDATTWNNMTSHAGYFLLLNVAMGGGFPNGVAGFGTPTSATVSGRPMVVDYVAVWQSGTGTTPPPSSPPPTGGVIQAESYNAQQGTQLGDHDRRGRRPERRLHLQRRLAALLGHLQRRDPVQRAGRVGRGRGVSGLVQVRLGSPTGTVIGELSVGNTGGWQSWRTVPANISPVSGTQTVYITFSSGQPADFVNLNYFTFSR